MTTLSRLTRTLTTATAVLALGLTAGCGGSSGPKTDGPAGTSTTSSSGVEVQTVALKKHGFSFQLPKGWSKIDRDGALNASNPVMKNMAEKLGTTPEKLIQYVETSVEVMAVTDQGADSGFLENVNVVPLTPGQATESQMRLQIAAVGGKTSDTSTVDTPIGKGVTITYTLATGGTVVAGKALAVGASSDDQVLITVSAHTASAAGDQLEAILASLAKI
ncbi:hypothetical protein [Nocardioides marmorisolisilvae]|uniref:Uncharacterized protein n=1 Tax=Nocardioides marmorisolisilvae TaxID=1542737 RepID=A0A3N0DWF7_9ACTN|nr:hypothetical protein [Nocardioides marmorisolisilvae]RNL79948.1 hypothetical protein EFL95_13555 [Nocardioides marmorisolisilvae]